MESSSKKALGIAAAIGGAALVITGGVLIARKKSGKRALGYVENTRDPDSLITSKTKSGGMTTTAYRTRGELPIELRIEIIQQKIAKSVKIPEMRQLALAITGKGGTVKIHSRTFEVKGANCPARDGECEARAIYKFKRDNLRYTGDIAEHVLDYDDTGGKKIVEAVDLYQTADRTLEFAGGDCDDETIVGATLALLNGLPVRVKTTSPVKRGDNNYTHIYDLVGLPKENPKRWAAIDSTLDGDNYFGIEARNAKSQSWDAKPATWFA